MWLAATFPVVVSGLELLRPRRRTSLFLYAALLVCLVLTLLLNIALSLFTFFFGIGVDPGTAPSTRVLCLVVAVVSAVLATGAVSALRSRRVATSPAAAARFAP